MSRSLLMAKTEGLRATSLLMQVSRENVPNLGFLRAASACSLAWLEQLDVLIHCSVEVGVQRREPEGDLEAQVGLLGRVCNYRVGARYVRRNCWNTGEVSLLAGHQDLTPNSDDAPTDILYMNYRVRPPARSTD